MNAGAAAHRNKLMAAIRIYKRLRELLDVALTSPADGEVLAYNAADGKWENSAAAGGGGAPTDADYLVGTANGSLSAEIVVGTSPGGELGGTWASPTVDATHSGSSHASVQAAAETTAASALASHSADTTGVHGIADTSVLETTTGAQAKADAAQSAAEAASQPLDPDLTSIAALDSSSGAIASDGEGWIKKTYAEFKTALSLVAADVGLGNLTNDAQLTASQLDTDAALAANLDTRIPSQKATKTYIDGKAKHPTRTIITATGTYTTPVGCTAILVECIGGGGQGGGCAATGAGQCSAGSGGSGGNYVASLLETLAASYSVAIGAGGSTSAAGNNTGQSGADTIFGSNVVVAKGGGGGGGGPVSPGTFPDTGSAGGQPQNGNVGDVTLFGAPGGNGFLFSALIPAAGGYGGAGAGFSPSEVFGIVAASGNGQAAYGYGQGGRGGCNLASQTAKKGGAGFAGVIIVTEFYGS